MILNDDTFIMKLGFFNIHESKTHLILIKGIFALVFLTFFLTGCQNNSIQKYRDLPNIILVITDDQGYGDLGMHGNPVIQTPTLDSLGWNSTRLTNFYVSPVCAPTRSSLMTGRYSLRTGVFDTYNGGAIMSETEMTMAEYLKKAGYRTGIFGKWHLGDTYPFRPQDQGFDKSFVHGGGGIGQPGDFYENYIKGDSSYFNPVLEFNGVKVNTSGYCSDVFTDLAIEFIKENRSGPFFAYISYNAPHTPLQVPKVYLQMYDTAEVHKMLSQSKGSDVETMTESEIESARRVYAMVSNIDHNFKRLWETIREEGITDNTLIIFMTDNGPQQRRYNAGLRNRKGSVYEGGIRVPSFWYWPGRFENIDRDFVSAHIDVLPTILDICSIPYNAGNPMDGMSLLPVLKGENISIYQRQLVHYWYRGYLEPYHNIAFRAGNLKLVAHGDYRMQHSDFELYDIGVDPFERLDISASSTRIVDSLKVEFDAWYADIMKSKNLDIQRIQIGTAHQNPVVLGRNDIKGASAKQWMSEVGYGYWDVLIAESGVYDIKVRFFNPVKIPGSISIRFGKVQRTIDWNESRDNLIVFKDIKLPQGPCVAEAWHQHLGKIVSPINVEVYKHAQ
jgi:arylsulfatase